MKSIGTVVITFDPAEDDVDIIKQKFSSIAPYYTNTQIDYIGDSEISQSIHYEHIPLHQLADIKNRLDVSDLQYSVFVN